MLSISVSSLPAMSDSMIERVRRVELASKENCQQIKIPIEHILHGGMYFRTARIPAGVMITGVLVRLETTVITCGSVMIHTGDEWIERDGYCVIPAAANRKQIFVAMTSVIVTMCFPTDAKTVKDAEERFTNEVNLLQSRSE